MPAITSAMTRNAMGKKIAGDKPAKKTVVVHRLRKPLKKK